MTGDLAFACGCGAVSGALKGLTPGHGVRFTCYCDDCQAYAHHLGHAERLNAHGGTDAYHADASRLESRGGLDQLAAVRVAQAPGRPVLRWYCQACRTPLINTYDTAQRSFLGLLMASADAGQAQALVGPSTGCIWRQYAAGDVSAEPSANLAAILWRLVRRQVAARLSGDWRRTPLFDQQTGRPIVEVRVLTPAERAEAEAKVARFREGLQG